MASNDLSPVTPGLEIHWNQGGDSGVTSSTAPRHMKFVRMTIDELDDLKSSNSTIELALFGVCFGVLVTLWITVKTVTLTVDDRNLFVSLAVIMSVLSVFFGGVTIRKEVRWRRRLKNIRQSADGSS